MLIGEITESMIRSKNKMPDGKDKRAIEEACNLLSKFDRMEDSLTILNKHEIKPHKMEG